MKTQSQHTETMQVVVSINDLKDRMFDGERLSLNEKMAVVNFDNYRLNRLNSVKNDPSFMEVYDIIRAEADLKDYREFL